MLSQPTIDGTRPEADNDEGKNHGTSRVDPPAQLGTSSVGQNTERIPVRQTSSPPHSREEVIAVVLPEDLDLRAGALDRVAVQEQRELDT